MFILQLGVGFMSSRLTKSKYPTVKIWEVFLLFPLYNRYVTLERNANAA